jgi:hypothetical protein
MSEPFTARISAFEERRDDQAVSLHRLLLDPRACW